MMNFLARALVLLASGVVSSVVSSSTSQLGEGSLGLKSQFDRWLSLHQKSYDPDNDEYVHRLSIFAKNAEIVKNHNDAHERGFTKYSMSLDGPFADLTNDEFEQHYLMTPQNCSATHVSSGPVPTTGKCLPKSVDWRTKGVITPIKNQKSCGSCWTFSTTGCLEAHHCLANTDMDCTHWTGLAEQQLVDCAGDYNNHGCEGGLPSQAFEYIHYAGGIMKETAYTYTAKDDGYCKKLVRKDIGATVSGVFNVTPFDEEEIVKAVAHIGPVSVAYQVSPDFRLYSHGVYDSFNATTNHTVCEKDAQHVNHAVVAVGYGETLEEKPIPFHIVRNSWGNTWGMEGYFWMVRGENMCGISDCASFPLVPPGGESRQKHHLRTERTKLG